MSSILAVAGVPAESAINWRDGERIAPDAHRTQVLATPGLAAAEILAPPDLARQIRRPLMPGQDPSVIWRDGWFYLAQSENNERGVTGIFIYKSRCLDGLSHGEKRCVWRAPRRGPLSRNIWAPELAWIDGFTGAGASARGHWYIYFAADDGRNRNHRMYALQSAGEEALGPYVCKGKIAAPGEDRWAIDGTVIDLEEPLGGGRKLYFLWSGWEGKYNGMQKLYIAAMRDPWTLAGPRIEISRPDQIWERRSGPSPCYVNEGPAAMVRNGRVIVAYSANGFWSDEYCLGLLSCDMRNVLDPAAWEKDRGPAFCKSDDVFGVGHNCFVQVHDGPEAGWWNIYHGTRRPNMRGKAREIFAQPFTWQANTPILGRPVRPDVGVALWR